jgi:succinate-semialdehyde dehydrogenase/glutarate-semialdehyde dehydrogenase
MGHGLDPASTVGPLINATQRDRVAALVDASVSGGGRARCGGRRPEGPGFFYPPTLLDGLSPDAPALREEVFGPVLPVQTFETTDEALRRAHDTEYGLAAYVFTRDLRTAFEVSERLDFGLVGVNDWYPVTAEAPFGGTRQSGLGRESGVEGLHEYVEARTRYFGGMP